MQVTRKSGNDLLELSFIASDPNVTELQKQVAPLRIVVAQLSQHYRAKHPKMIEAVDSLNEGERQLRAAIATTTAQVEANYQASLQNYSQARAALAEQETSSLSLDRFGVEYTNMERDFTINEKLLENILGRMRETSMSSSVESQNARLVDRAIPGRKPIYPNYLLNLSLGLLSGLISGLGLAFFVGYLDDRVKSAYDIEVVIGLPLLTIIPKFKTQAPSADTLDTAFVQPQDPEVNEAFSTLY